MRILMNCIKTCNSNLSILLKIQIEAMKCLK